MGGVPIPDGKAALGSSGSKADPQPKAKAEPKAKAAQGKAGTEPNAAKDGIEDAVKAISNEIKAVKARLAKENIVGKQLNDHPEIVALAEKLHALLGTSAPPAPKEGKQEPAAKKEA